MILHKITFQKYIIFKIRYSPSKYHSLIMSSKNQLYLVSLNNIANEYQCLLNKGGKGVLLLKILHH